jgi:hypothetical protein
MPPSVFPSFRKVVFSISTLLAGSLACQAQNDVLTWHNFSGGDEQGCVGQLLPANPCSRSHYGGRAGE